MSKNKMAFLIVSLLSILTICGFIFEKDDNEIDYVVKEHY